MSVTIYGLSAFKPELKGVIRDVRCLWVLEELGESYNHVVMDPTKGENRTPEYLAIHPLGKVPSMVDGSVTLFESAAICEYLGQKHGRLVPTLIDSEYHQYKQWLYYAIANVEPQTNRIFGADFFSEKNDVTATIRKASVDALARFLGHLNTQLAGKQYLLPKFGLSVADVLLASSLRSAEHTGMYSDYPNVQKYMDGLKARPAFQKASAKNGVKA